MARRLRVIAGTAGGLRLRAPAGIRPTTDRVREAVFSALGDEVVSQASVLDLYAGSGALGIEAASRGAGAVVLVEHDRAGLESCRHNVATARLDERVRVVAASVEAFLRREPPADAPFDLVVADPPYDLVGALDMVVHALARPGWLAPGAVVVLEGGRGTDPSVPSGWERMWLRKYGDTLVVALRVVSPNPEPASGA